MISTIEGMKIEGDKITMTSKAAKELIDELKTMIDETEHHDVYKSLLVIDNGQFKLTVRK